MTRTTTSLFCTRRLAKPTAAHLVLSRCLALAAPYVRAQAEAPAPSRPRRTAASSSGPMHTCRYSSSSTTARPSRRCWLPRCRPRAFASRRTLPKPRRSWPFAATSCCSATRSSRKGRRRRWARQRRRPWRLQQRTAATRLAKPPTPPSPWRGLRAAALKSAATPFWSDLALGRMADALGESTGITGAFNTTLAGAPRGICLSRRVD